MERRLDDSIANKHLFENYSGVIGDTMVAATPITATVAPLTTTTTTVKPATTIVSTAPTATTFTGKQIPSSTLTEDVSTYIPLKPLAQLKPLSTTPLRVSPLPIPLPVVVPMIVAPSPSSMGMGGGGGGGGAPEEQKQAEGGAVDNRMFGLEPEVLKATIGLSIIGGIAGYFYAKQSKKSLAICSLFGFGAGSFVSIAYSKVVLKK